MVIMTVLNMATLHSYAHSAYTRLCSARTSDCLPSETVLAHTGGVILISPCTSGYTPTKNLALLDAPAVHWQDQGIRNS